MTDPKLRSDRSWAEQQQLDDMEAHCERDPNSSVSAQYEDHILPDNSWQHEDES